MAEVKKFGTVSMVLDGAQKFITKNDKTGAIGKKYHTTHDCQAAQELRLIVAPEPLLRHYGITEECKICAQTRKRIKSKDLELDLKKYMPLLSNASIIIQYQIGRERLRAYCTEYRLPFTKRSTKPNMARAVCRYWIRNKHFDCMRETVDAAIIHWQDRIDKDDRHRPYFFVEMRDRCNYVYKLLEGVTTV